MPTDEYIDTLLDATDGYPSQVLELLLEERDLLFAAMEACGAIKRRP